MHRIDVSKRGSQIKVVDNEEKMIVKRLKEIMLSDKKESIPSLKKVNFKKLKEEIDLVNGVIENITTENITEVNHLMYAGANVVAERLGKMRKHSKKGEQKEPWWKRRIEKNIKQWRHDISRIEERRKGNCRLEGREMERMNRKYDLENRGNIGVLETLKAKVQSGSAKIRSFDERRLQYHQNSLFATNQKQLYKELSGGKEANEKPNPQEATNFWRNTWSKPVSHNGQAVWLDKVKEKLGDITKQENIQVNLDSVRKGIRRMTNWKSPGPDGVQGYWFKKFTHLHGRISEHLQECIEIGLVPEWMTTGRTSLIRKDQEKGNAASNYRPITCLPLMWKLLTSLISEKMYEHLVENDVLPDEQKGCRERSRGTKDQLLIDKTILKHCKRHQRNLAMGWIDYKKAYDMVPHSWLIEAVKMVGVAENIVELLRKSMETWKTQLTACGDVLGEVNIKRGIFQGDSLSPLLFVVTLIPLTILLRESGLGYDLGDANDKLVNHLLFMDDLKVYGTSEAMLDSLIQTVRIFSDDIGMEFGLDKCGILVLKRGKVIRSDGVELPNGENMKEIDLEGYKYLGVLQYDEIQNKTMKEKVKREYFRRIKLLMRSKLNGGNVILGVNSWAVGIVRYGAGVLDWTKG